MAKQTISWVDRVENSGATADGKLSAAQANEIKDVVNDNFTENYDAIAAHVGDTENPHSVTKTQVGLGNVDNTSDVTKEAATIAAIRNGVPTAGDDLNKLYENRNIVGEIINDSVIDSYSLVGGNTSQSTVSGKRRLTASTNVTNYSNFLDLDYITWLEKFEFSVILTPVADGNGIALGFINSGTSGFFVLLDMNTAGARGTLTLVSSASGTPTTLLASSANLITYSNSDELTFVLKRDGYRLVVSVFVNGTIAGSLDYNASLNNVSMSIGKINKLSIAQLGGTQDLSNITFSSNCKRNTQIAIVGDSNTYGFNLASSGGVYEDTYSQIVGNAMVDGAVVYAANGAKLSDFQAQLDEFLLLKPSFVSIHLGTNDAVTSVTDTAYLATLDAIINTLLDADVGVILNTVIPTTTGGYNTFIVSYNVGISARNTKVLVVGQYAAFQSGGLLQAEDHTDGIHLSILGQRKFASTFIAATPFLKNNNHYPFLVGDGDRVVVVTPIGKQTTKDIVETSFDSTQISDAETESGWSNGLKVISNTIEGQYHRNTTTGYEYYCYSDGNCLRRVYGDATTAEENGIITLPDVITADSAFANNISSCKVTNSATKLNISLPTTCPVGTLCRVVGLGSGGWKIVQNSGQSIKYDAATSTTGTGGSIESNLAQYASITLMCIVANTTFSVVEGSPVSSLMII